MKYEAPELTAWTPAISAIQDVNKKSTTQNDTGGTPIHNEPLNAYADWED